METFGRIGELFSILRKAISAINSLVMQRIRELDSFKLLVFLFLIIFLVVLSHAR